MPVAEPSNPRGMSPLPSVKRSRGEDPYPIATHRWNSVPQNCRDIEGWGADLDPKDRPMVPKELPSDVQTVRGDVQYWQQPSHRVFVSNEMPDLTPVFGTSCPPKGLSGRIREAAFEHSEGTVRHWTMLMLADRVDIVESLVTSALRGRPDNIIAEKAWLTRLTNNDPGGRKRLLLGAAGVALFAWRFLGTPRGRRMLPIRG
jgi:hypothetical protein